MTIEHYDKPQITIQISASKRANGFKFTAQDDGLDIPSGHQVRLFAMFQTRKTESSGMALALVKKAVKSVEGHVILESDGQHGCAFRFTWPINNSDKKTQ